MRNNIITSIIIFVGLYPTIIVIPKLTEPLLASLPFHAKNMLNTAIIVGLMVFFIIPFVTKVFAKLGLVKK
ncbi:MAG: hypothetical protein HRT66_06450 [Flavobacteriaceae bacterium]|nr:hypothetical protein [Flavobacteriaceae bacterium]